MSTKSKTLAKSLHTVSVLVSVGRYYMQDDCTAVDAVAAALDMLGYDPKGDDPYGLAARAVAILESGK